MSWLYVVVAVVLVLFGVAGLLSVGAPLLLTGLVMLLCFPWRHRRNVLWPSLAGVWGLTLGYVLVAPLGCTSSGGGPVGGVASDAATTCNGLLLGYSGGSSYNPPLMPALLAGLATDIAAALAAKLFVGGRSGPVGT